MPEVTPITTDLASSSSVLQDYGDNCDYDLENSLTKCAAFIKACRKILANPSLMTRGGTITNTLQFDLNQVSEQLKKAEAWYRNNNTSSNSRAGSQTTLVNFPSDFRD